MPDVDGQYDQEISAEHNLINIRPNNEKSIKLKNLIKNK
jgi:hypothetical protein